jgi:hypothetical protein
MMDAPSGLNRLNYRRRGLGPSSRICLIFALGQKRIIEARPRNVRFVSKARHIRFWSASFPHAIGTDQINILIRPRAK